PGQWRRDARHESHGTQVYVLVELAPELNNRTVQGNMIGNGIWPADGAEEYGVGIRQATFPVVGHHRSMPGVIVAGGKVVPFLLKGEAIQSIGALENPDAFPNNFFSNAVTGNHSDPVDTFGRTAVTVQGWTSLLSPPI